MIRKPTTAHLLPEPHNEISQNISGKLTEQWSQSTSNSDSDFIRRFRGAPSVSVNNHLHSLGLYLQIWTFSATQLAIWNEQPALPFQFVLKKTSSIAPSEWLQWKRQPDVNVRCVVESDCSSVQQLSSARKNPINLFANAQTDWRIARPPISLYVPEDPVSKTTIEPSLTFVSHNLASFRDKRATVHGRSATGSNQALLL